MSKMSDLYLEILEMLDAGYSPKNISRILECPLSMVYDVNEIRDEDEEYSPFETVNS